MNSTIVINRRTPIDLKGVSVIEALTPGEIDKLAERYNGNPNDFAIFNSAVRLVDGSTELAVQTLEDLRRLAKGRVLNMASAGSGNGKALSGPLIPLEAIRHLEPISDEERGAMKAAYGDDAAPEAIDAKRTRIVYRALDPANPQRYFQKTFQADILDDLLDRDKGFLIDIGGGKYVLADEIEDARPLSERDTQRLSRKYALKARDGNPLITSVVLTGEEFILSSLPAETIETLVERPLPSLNVEKPAKKGKAKPSADKVEPALG
jgi:hypothetical protein